MKVATEEQEHLAFMQWLKLKRLDEFAIHIPNGGSRNKIEAAKLKKMGVQKGIPDFFFPLPNEAYSGLFIELKRIRGFKISPEQNHWMNKLNDLGYLACFAWGWEHAVKIVNDYLGD